MARVKGGFTTRKRHKKVLKMASGFRGAKSKLYKAAKETLDRALAYAYRDRKAKKRDFRKLWITRINAAARMHGLSYSALMGKLKANNVNIDRKMRADLAYSDPKAFEAVVKSVNS